MSSLRESEGKRGRIEEQLRRQLDFTRAITNSIGEGIYALDGEGRVTFLNRVAEELLGWKEAELLGKNMHDAIHFRRADGTHLAAEECELLKVIESGVTFRSEEDTFTRKDGTTFPVSYTSSPILSDGKVSGAVLAFRDMTARRRIEAELREQNELVETINRVGNMLAAELDLQKVVQAVTDAATELTGAQFGSFFYNVLNEEGASYMLYTLSGVPREVFAHFPMPRATDLFGPTFRGEGVLRIADVKKDARYGKNSPYYGMPEGHLPVTSYLAVPVISRSGEVVGGLFFGHPEEGVFSERHERLVVGLAAQAAIAMDNARLFEALRRSESRVRRLVESDLIGIVFATINDGRITDANDAFLRMAGYTREELREGLVRWREMTPREFAHLDVLAIQAMRTKGTAVPYEKEYVRKDGTRLPVMIGIALLEGSDDECVAFILDITERKRVETALRQSEELNQAVLNSLTAHIAVLDREGNIIAVNEPWRRFAESNEGALLRTGVGTNYLHVCEQAAGGEAGSARETLLGIRAVLEGASERFTVEYSCHSPDEERWFLLHANPLPGERGGAVVSHLNITERVHAEEELKASEQRYHALTDAMPQLVWATDAEGQHFFYNQRWYEYTGLSEEESLGYGFAKALHPDDYERTIKRWERAWREGEGYEIEYRFYSRPRDEYRWFLGRAVPVRDETGRLAQWVGTCTDIEEQKRMEERLAQLSREREQMFQEVSTPLVPVWSGVLVLPIIGSLDTARMQQATQAALAEVRRTGARACIIDITGARLIDSHAVANLSNLVLALRLVGAEAIVTGIGAHAAQSIVGLGLDLKKMRTYRTLEQALAAIINTPATTFAANDNAALGK